MKRALTELETALGNKERCATEVARLEARKTALEAQMTDEKSQLESAEAEAVLDRLSGRDRVAADVRGRRDDLRLTEGAITECGRQLDAARLATGTAIANVNASRRTVEQLTAAAALDEIGPAVEAIVTKIVEVDPHLRFALAKSVAGFLNRERLDGATIAAELKKLASDLRERVERTRVGAVSAAKPVRPALVNDTPVFSSRAFTYRTRSSEEVTAPSNWVGFVPKIVADQLLSLKAAEILTRVAWYRANVDFHIVAGSTTKYLHAGKSYLLSVETVERHVAANQVTELPKQVEEADYKKTRVEDHSFMHPLQLGLVEEPEEVSASQDPQPGNDVAGGVPTSNPVIPAARRGRRAA